VVDLAFRLTGDAEDARDIRQTAFLRLLGSLDSLNGTCSFSTWFYRVVLNLCLDHRRSRKASDKRGAGRGADRAESSGPSPPQCTEQEEAARLVAGAVAALAPPERTVVVLKHYQNLTFEETATILGLPASTVKSRMQKALLSLREKLKNVEI